MKLLIVTLMMVLLVACASGPRYDTRTLDNSLTASRAAHAPNPPSGARVVWGGVIIATRNQANTTEMEILSYPLDSDQRPDPGQNEQGRFIARYSGYLEAVDYGPGRLVTLSGSITKVMEGKVGEAPYTFPVIEAKDIYLWPRTGRPSTSPQFHFGVGVIFGH